MGLFPGLSWVLHFIPAAFTEQQPEDWDLSSWDPSAGPLTLGRPVTWSGWASGVVTELVEGVSGALGALG